MGNNTLKQVKAGRMEPSAKGTATAGMILGILSVAIAAATIVFLVYWAANFTFR